MPQPLLLRLEPVLDGQPLLHKLLPRHQADGLVLEGMLDGLGRGGPQRGAGSDLWGMRLWEQEACSPGLTLAAHAPPLDTAHLGGGCAELAQPRALGRRPLGLLKLPVLLLALFELPLNAPLVFGGP